MAKFINLKESEVPVEIVRKLEEHFEDGFFLNYLDGFPIESAEVLKTIADNLTKDEPYGRFDTTEIKVGNLFYRIEFKMSGQPVQILIFKEESRADIMNAFRRTSGNAIVFYSFDDNPDVRYFD